jgi:hypothetical protein
MKLVSDAIKGLDPGAAGRVLRWVAEAHGIDAPQPRPTTAQPTEPKNTIIQNPYAALDEPQDIAEFYASINPSSDTDKALVIGYWLQYREGMPDLDTQSVNSQLKQLGHGIGNITRAFDNLTRTKPQLVIQTRKAGSSQQARKKFKLTFEGKRRVETQLMEGG